MRWPSSPHLPTEIKPPPVLGLKSPALDSTEPRVFAKVVMCSIITICTIYVAVYREKDTTCMKCSNIVKPQHNLKSEVDITIDFWILFPVDTTNNIFPRMKSRGLGSTVKLIVTHILFYFDQPGMFLRYPNLKSGCLLCGYGLYNLMSLNVFHMTSIFGGQCNLLTLGKSPPASSADRKPTSRPNTYSPPGGMDK